MKEAEEWDCEAESWAVFVDETGSAVLEEIAQTRNNIEHLHREFMKQVDDEFTVLFYKLDELFEVDED